MDFFSSPRTRVSWANDQIAELDAAIKGYVASTPCKGMVELESNGVNEWHKIKVDPLPHKCVFLVTKIGEDLRSALDQTGYAAALAGGNKTPKKAYFPICKDASQFDNAVSQNCRDLPDEIRALFRAYKACPGGDMQLVALNGLCGTTKHAILKPIAQTVGGAFYKNLRTIKVNPPFIMGGMPKWDAEKNEIKLFVAGKGSQIQYNITLSIFVAFGEVEVVSGQPVIPVLNALRDKVSGVIDATEAECRRIGLIK